MIYILLIIENQKIERISFNLCKSRNLYLTYFKTKRENYKSNSITVIDLEKNSYPYFCIAAHVSVRGRWSVVGKGGRGGGGD